MEPRSATAASESNWKPIVIGVAVVVAVVGVVAVLLRTPPKAPAAPPPYAASLKFSDTKMSAAENFVGATVTYLDGTLSNLGDKTVTHAVVQVNFKNSLGELAQSEEVPVHVLKTGGPYVEAVDLAASPLGAGQSQPFRLTFEHVTADWNHEYPEMTIRDVVTK